MKNVRFTFFVLLIFTFCFTAVLGSQICRSNDVTNSLECLKEAILPREVPSIETWPGNHGSSRYWQFFWGSVYGLIEILLVGKVLHIALTLYTTLTTKPKNRSSTSISISTSHHIKNNNNINSESEDECTHTSLTTTTTTVTQPLNPNHATKAQLRQVKLIEKLKDMEEEPTSRLSILLSFIELSTLGSIALFGYLYWSYFVLVWYNFICWLMLAGVPLFLPGIVQTRRVQQSALQYIDCKVEGKVNAKRLIRKVRLIGQSALMRRWIAGGVVLAVICGGMFQNFSVIPQQAYRHAYMSSTILTPHDPSVEMIVSWFYGNHSYEQFSTLQFEEQMYLVDKFIYNTITWKSDMELYSMIGLLVTPEEVIAHQAGDCQGQAVTTTSMLINMGFNAAAVETPFHWWTRARCNSTGKVYNLNYHGSAWNQGSVLPQPVDLAVTYYDAECDVNDCGYNDAFNRDRFVYIANPLDAFTGAWIGTHIFVREMLPGYLNGNEYKLYVQGVVLGLVMAVFATYVQGDIKSIFLPSHSGKSRLLLRIAFAVPLGIEVMVVMFAWTIIHYHFVVLHLVFSIGYSLNWIAGDMFNSAIGTPNAIKMQTLRACNLRLQC